MFAFLLVVLIAVLAFALGLHYRKQYIRGMHQQITGMAQPLPAAEPMSIVNVPPSAEAAIRAPKYSS